MDAREWLARHYPNHARSAEGIDTLPAMLESYAAERCSDQREKDAQIVGAQEKKNLEFAEAFAEKKWATLEAKAIHGAHECQLAAASIRAGEKP